MSHADATVPRPALCPYCNSKAIDTLAKVFTARTLWRCRECSETWTIGGPGAPPRQ
jgi:ribosomal protein L37AE/L43A